MKYYDLDSRALIAFFRNEEGADKVDKILTSAALLECEIIMHNVSVAEFYYDSIYFSSKEDADLLMEKLLSFPIDFIQAVEIDLIKQVGYFKTTYKVSFADCFVLGTARLYKSTIVTSDHHEFNVIEEKGDALFEWIR